MLGFIQVLKEKKQLQYLLSFGLIMFIAVTSFLLGALIDYRVVALILLLAVSIIAMLFEIRTVLFTAIFSALLWNFFFIPPIYTFTIGTPEDVLLFLMYFVIALLNAVLTSKIRKAESKARDKEEKEKTIKLYNTLLNSLSHELKTPISTIIGAVDTLRDKNLKLSIEAERELLEEIDFASIRLNRQVENLLSMSRLESGFVQLQLDWTDMNEMVNNIIQTNYSDFSNHEIQINIDDDIPLFKIDRFLIEQVIYNLLHNAVQYTPNNSKIILSIKDRNGCYIEISDNGPGFPNNKIITVFEKFYRLPQSATGGTGLGLSIVKGIVEAHNGTVKLENLPEKGAKFTVFIPSETTTFKTEEDVS